MNAFSTFPADRSSLSRVADRVEASLNAQALAAQHIAALETVPLLTDFPFALNEAARLAKRVRGLANLPNAGPGLLGANGVGPAVDACVRSAGFHGFEWRARLESLDLGRVGIMGQLPSATERFLIDLASDCDAITSDLIARTRAGFALHFAAFDHDLADRAAQRALDAMKEIGA